MREKGESERGEIERVRVRESEGERERERKRVTGYSLHLPN